MLDVLIRCVQLFIPTKNSYVVILISVSEMLETVCSKNVFTTSSWDLMKWWGHHIRTYWHVQVVWASNTKIYQNYYLWQTSKRLKDQEGVSKETTAKTKCKSCKVVTLHTDTLLLWSSRRPNRQIIMNNKFFPSKSKHSSSKRQRGRQRCRY